MCGDVTAHFHIRVGKRNHGVRGGSGVQTLGGGGVPGKFGVLLCWRAAPFLCGVLQKLGGVFRISGGVLQKVGGVFQTWRGVLRISGGVVKKPGGVLQTWRGVFQKTGGVVRKLGGVVKLWRGVGTFGQRGVGGRRGDVALVRLDAVPVAAGAVPLSAAAAAAVIPFPPEHQKNKKPKTNKERTKL